MLTRDVSNTRGGGRRGTDDGRVRKECQLHLFLHFRLVYFFAYKFQSTMNATHEAHRKDKKAPCIVRVNAEHASPISYSSMKLTFYT